MASKLAVVVIDGGDHTDDIFFFVPCLGRWWCPGPGGVKPGKAAYNILYMIYIYIYLNQYIDTSIILYNMSIYNISIIPYNININI